MCLVTDNIELKTANEDLVVYKVLVKEDGVIMSPFRGSVYELDRLYESEFSFVKPREVDEEDVLWWEKTTLWSYCCDIDQWYFNEKYGDSNEVTDLILSNKILVVQKGWHSCWRHNVVKLLIDTATFKRYVFKCIIPKGSQYYTSAWGGLVSNQIIVKEEISLKDVVDLVIP